MQGGKMNWKNLKDNKCPKCNKDWAFDLTVVDGLLAHGCGFKIRESRYKEIVTSMTNEEIEAIEEKEKE